MDLGSARVTGIVRPAYEKLIERLGFGEVGECIDVMQQLYEVDERVLEYLDVDVQGISMNPPIPGTSIR